MILLLSHKSIGLVLFTIDYCYGKNLKDDKSTSISGKPYE